MGYDAACTLIVDGRTARGTAWLEQKDLIFRGPIRVAIPLQTITSAVATDGTLRVRFDDREADFRIGPAAAKWAARITNPPSRLDKIGVKANMTVGIVGRVDDDFLRDVERQGATVTSRVSGRAGSLDLVFVAADRREVLDRLASLRDAIKPNGALWVLRPKGQRAITEADTMAAGKRAGLVDIKVVSFSETHSAEKYVIPVAKRAAAARPSSSAPRTRRSSASRARK